MNVSAEYQMSRGEAWRVVMAPRPVFWLVAAAFIVLPHPLFHPAPPADVGRAVMMLVILVVGRLSYAGISRPFAVPTTVTLTDTTLTVIRPGETTAVPWSEVKRVGVKYRHWFVLVENQRPVAIIPMRALGKEQRAAVKLLAKQATRRP
ncbi:MAG: YcxB family protein [Catenulispora sp.]|nr:YcxB family protein [Catenulispora sp.]